MEEKVVLNAHVFEDLDGLLVEVQGKRLVGGTADLDVGRVGSREFDHRFTQKEGVVLEATVQCNHSLCPCGKVSTAQLCVLKRRFEFVNAT